MMSISEIPDKIVVRENDHTLTVLTLYQSYTRFLDQHSSSVASWVYFVLRKLCDCQFDQTIYCYITAMLWSMLYQPPVTIQYVRWTLPLPLQTNPDRWYSSDNDEDEYDPSDDDPFDHPGDWSEEIDDPVYDQEYGIMDPSLIPDNEWTHF